MGRHDKVKEVIKRQVSAIVHDELNDPRLGFITITEVALSADMRHAKVFFSALGGEDDYKKTQTALDSALGFIRRLVAERINLKFAPEIIFRQDRSGEHSIRIQQVLDEIKKLPGAAKKEAVIPREGARAGKRKAKKYEPKKSRRVNKKK